MGETMSGRLVVSTTDKGKERKKRFSEERTLTVGNAAKPHLYVIGLVEGIWLVR